MIVMLKMLGSTYDSTQNGKDVKEMVYYKL